VIGQLFGNYRASSLLGEGGMGAVYLAEHPEIGRRVAVKVLRPELIKDPQLLTRFLNEARAANAIRHPNIIEILDSGTRVDGTPYLVMELLEGEPLSARVRRGPLPVHDALEFTYQATSALSAAHAKGIIHRDLKPDNLFIIKDPHDPERERIKVLDFGIAKLQTTLPGEGMRTRTGTLMGTPVYMSPEQCLGTKTLDQRSDIYSMGIILFEMLAGRPPFFSEGFGELVNMHLNIPPPVLRAINTAVPEVVETLVNRALAKAPAARQQTAADLQKELRAAAAGRSMIIRGTSSPDLGTSTPSTGPGFTAVLPDTSSTFSTGTGERHTLLPARPRRRGLMVALGVAAAAAGVGGWMYASGRIGGTPGAVRAGGGHPASGGASSGAAKAPAPVKVTVDSRPAGASVVDSASGEALGLTPVVIERVPSAVPATVRIERAGFVPVTREVTFDKEKIIEVVLAEARPALPEEPTKAAGTRDQRPGEEKGEPKGRDRDRGRKSTHKAQPRPGSDEPAKL
jgi:serine/threonine-protein kinase